MYLKHVITAGILSAALAIGPGAAYAQTAGSASGSSGSSQGTTSGSSSSQGTGSQDSASQPSTQGSQSNSQGSSGADQDAVRQHLTAAREALAELTKLPAASQLQGEQRQQVAQFISDFNAFATATTDWRPKYDAVDKSLDQLLGLGGSASAAGSASGSGSAADAGSAGASTGSTADTAPASAGAAGTAGASSEAGASGLDPTIEAKLREVRTHLDQFEVASGDPTFVVEKIEKILDQASSGASASGPVGTSGTSTAGASDGAVTLSAAQVQEIRRQLDSIKAAAKR